MGETFRCTKSETAATVPLVVTGAFWRILDTSKHSAEQHATLTANQQNSTATQLRLVHKKKIKHTSMIRIKRTNKTLLKSPVHDL